MRIFPEYVRENLRKQMHPRNSILSPSFQFLNICVRGALMFISCLLCDLLLSFCLSSAPHTLKELKYTVSYMFSSFNTKNNPMQ